MPTTILILAANPSETARIRVDQEIRDIQEGLERARLCSRFQLVTRTAVRRQDIRRAVLDLRPTVVHFCGHGSAEEGNEGLVFEDDQGGRQIVDGETLQAFFAVFAEHVRCVVLNACYSETQAKAIAAHIDFVVGMKDALSDPAALAYVVAFYDALGAGTGVVEAHDLGRNAIQWARLEGHLIPQLIARKGAAPNLMVPEQSDGESSNSVTGSPRKTLWRPLLMAGLVLGLVAFGYWYLDPSHRASPVEKSDASTAVAEVQVLKGQVLDGATGEALAGAKVEIAEYGLMHVTGEQGRFTFEISAAAYQRVRLRISMEEFEVKNEDPMLGTGQFQTYRLKRVSP